MKSLITLFLIFSFFLVHNSNAQGYDYTFCLGRIKLQLNASGDASQVLLNSNGSIQSRVTGTYEKYDEGRPTEIIKVNFKGIEYRYELIKNGNGRPSLIIDAQGRKYNVCGTQSAKEKSLEDLIAESEADAAKRNQEEAAFKLNAKKYFADIKALNSKASDPASKWEVPRNYDGLAEKYNYIDLTRYFTKAETDFFNLFIAKKDKIIAENMKNTGDKYGIVNNWNLNNYFNTNGQKVFLPQECKSWIFKDGELYNNSKGVGGYVIDGNVYNSKDVLVGKLEQDEKYYFIDNVRMRAFQGNVNEPLIQIRTSKELVYKDMEYTLKSDIYNLTKKENIRGNYCEIWTIETKVSKGCILNAMVSLHDWFNFGR